MSSMLKSEDVPGDSYGGPYGDQDRAFRIMHPLKPFTVRPPCLSPPPPPPPSLTRTRTSPYIHTHVHTPRTLRRFTSIREVPLSDFLPVCGARPLHHDHQVVAEAAQLKREWLRLLKQPSLPFTQSTANAEDASASSGGLGHGLGSAEETTRLQRRSPSSSHRRLQSTDL